MQMPKAEHINPVITVRKRVASSTHLPLTTMTESRAAFHPARFHAATGIPSLANNNLDGSSKFMRGHLDRGPAEVRATCAHAVS
jgi:hypothetical protein